MNRDSVRPADATALLVGALDRGIPVSLGEQLRGLVEYGISCGVLKQGTRLPSIRVLAQASGLSAETIAAAYRVLHERKLLVSRHGSGTYVADAEVAWGRKADALAETERRVDELLRAARSADLSTLDLFAIIRARDALPSQARRSVRIVMVGIFEEASHAYAQDLAGYLDPADTVDAVTVEQLRAHLSVRPAADLYVCLPTRQVEVAGLVGGRAPVTSLSVIPADRTRSFLAGLDPAGTVALVSRFPGFLGLMLAGAHTFAPHVRTIEAFVLEDEALEAKLARMDVVIYATGAGEVVRRLPPGAVAFEYRHTPDPHAIGDRFLPLVERVRAAMADMPGRREQHR